MKLTATALALVVTTADAFAPLQHASRHGLALFSDANLGAGGMADTRDPDTFEHEDPRKSISAAPSFEEYLKQRAAGGDASGAAVSPAPVAVPVPAPAPATAVPSTPAVGGGSASGASAVAAFSAAQSASVDAIAAAIGPDLEQKPDYSWTSESIDGSPATLDGREAPGANGNVAWLASTAVEGKLSSLTIFNGPLTDVPHLLSRAVIVGDSIRLTMDFRPRAYGAYEMRNADGSYPGPDVLGRDAFTYSGNRKEYDSKFGTEEVISFMEGLSTDLEGAIANDAEPSEVDSQTRGPLFVDITCSLTEGNVATIAAARSKAAEYWLSWAMDTGNSHRPGAPVNSQYVYDEKFRINAYQALLEDYSALYGPGDGAKLAAAESGPLGEAYVGGGS